MNGEGILYFFGTITIQHEIYHSFEEILVCYSEQTIDLTDIAIPQDIKEYGMFAENDMIAAEEICMLDEESSLWEGKEMTEEERNIYQQLEEMIQAYNYFDPPDTSYYNSINIMGHSPQIQGCVLYETALKHLKQGWYSPDKNQYDNSKEPEKQTMLNAALQWRHLFSFRTDCFTKLSQFEDEFNLQMDGIFYVMIKQDELDNMNFTSTESVYQHT